MDNLKIAIVDDELQPQKNIAAVLKKYYQERQIPLSVKGFASGEAFLKSDSPFDIVFMDIYMNGMSGVETATKMRETDTSTLLVFLTTSTEYMPQAFSYHAFDYIEKPATVARIFKVMDDALKILPPTEKFLELTVNRQKIKLLYKKIMIVESDKHYINITDSNGNMLKSRMNFSACAEILVEDKRFMVIKKGILINMDYIKNFEDRYCILSDETELPIKLRDKALLEQQWIDYCFEQIRTRGG